MAEDLQRALREVRDTLLDQPVSPRVEEPREINLHYCRYVAETVADRVGDVLDVAIVEDGGRGYVHTWLVCDGRHYDAECIEGVADYRDLPFFERHPEAAIQVEPESTDPAVVRNRGMEPLYPEIFSSDRSSGGSWLISTQYAKQAVAGVVIGLALVAIGAGGLWAVHQHLVQGPWLEVLFYDLEIAGELIVLVAPIVFLVLLPAQRRSERNQSKDGLGRR